MLPTRQLLSFAPRYIAIRAMASAAQASDPIQKLFLEKIQEYNEKSKSAPNGLVDSNDKVQQQLSDDLLRVANNYGITDMKNITDLGLKFGETCHLDSINLRK